MKCPHCLDSFHEDWGSSDYLGSDEDYAFEVRNCACPACKRKIVQLGRSPTYVGIVEWTYVYPKAISRSPIPKEVHDQTLIDSYNQACLVLADSPMASAALSRRCLQHILREKAKVTASDLYKEIDDVIATGKLPSELESSLDAIRHIGNFATHPMKSTNTGEIIEVEPGEADWNLEVVEQLMDHYYVRPALSLQKKIALNLKLKEAGKPELPI